MLKLNEAAKNFSICAMIAYICMFPSLLGCERDQLAEGTGEVITLVKEEDTYRQLNRRNVFFSVDHIGDFDSPGAKPLSGIYAVVPKTLGDDDTIITNKSISIVFYYYAMDFYVKTTTGKMTNNVNYVQIVLELDPENGYLISTDDKFVIEIGERRHSIIGGGNFGAGVFTVYYSAKLIRNITKKMDIEQ